MSTQPSDCSLGLACANTCQCRTSSGDSLPKIPIEWEPAMSEDDVQRAHELRCLKLKHRHESWHEMMISSTIVIVALIASSTALAFISH